MLPQCTDDGEPAAELIGSSLPLVALVVVHFASLDDTRACLDSLGRLTYRHRITVVVHNGTAPESLALVQEYPDLVHEVISANRGYAAGVNRGAAAAAQRGARYVYALNNDTQLDAEALEGLVALCEGDTSIGVAGGMHYYYDRRQVVQNSGSYIDWVTGKVRTKGEGSSDSELFLPVDEPDFICGAGFFFPVSVMQRVGEFDEGYFLYCEESDWCLRVRAAGYRIVRLACSRLYHRGGSAVQKTGTYPYYATRNKLWLIRRWAPAKSWAAFLGLHLAYCYPKMLFGLALRRDWDRLGQTVRGIRDGLLSMPQSRRAYPAPQSSYAERATSPGLLK